MMEYLQVAIRLLLAGLIDGPASVFVGATGGRKISFAASSPARELAAPSHKTMSQTTWYQNRGPASAKHPFLIWSWVNPWNWNLSFCIETYWYQYLQPNQNDRLTEVTLGYW